MIVLCTGCRSGFGKLFAASAARAGHTVYAGVRDPAASPELVEATRGLPVKPIALDVTDEAQRQAAVERILRDEGRIDALVNNAGVGLAGFQEQVATDELRRLFEINVIAPHALTRLCLPHLRASRGLVMNISSMSGRQPFPGAGAYAASKFAMEGMTEALRHEMRPFGVRVVLVEPGPYKTDIFERNRWDARELATPGPYTSYIEKLTKVALSRKMGDPQEVADLMARLLTEPNPKLRYALGPTVQARLLLQKTMPFEVIERILARIVGV